VVGVKRGERLALHVDGRLVDTVDVPAVVTSRAGDFAIGGNPNYGGSEFLAAQMADLKFYARALTADQVKQLHEATGQGRD
jgi:hypothetical protein